MRVKLTVLTMLMFFQSTICVTAQSATEILHQMYKRYEGKWYNTFTFNQTTEMYRNDSLKRKETWYEAVKFPHLFRIDFGVPDSGNAVIFKGDSSYDFRRGKLRRTTRDANDLTFLLGGMYFYSFDKVIEKVKTLQYDLQKSFSTTWKGAEVYVIGAASADEKVNQLWIDKKKLVLVRQLKYENNRKEDMWFENHIKLGGGWTETKVTAYFDEKLFMIEHYHDCKANPQLNDLLFDPTKFGQWHWYKKQ
jgi:hypothetical protein